MISQHSPFTRVLFNICILSSMLLSGCSLTEVPLPENPCNIQAYVDDDFETFLSKRFPSKEKPRVAVIPFEVPANFSPIMEPQLRLGNDLAYKFQNRILQYQDMGMIVEVFNRSNWPGKSMDFETGNYLALQQARYAGYDVVVLGKLFSFTNDTSMRLHTKAIDVDSGVTIWFAETITKARQRPTRSLFNWLSRGFYPERYDEFELQPRFDYIMRCTAQRMLRVED